MNILFGISGGIAAYKAPELVRALRGHGHSVRSILTEAGGRMVAAQAIAAVAAEPVWTSMWCDEGSIPHIDLPRWCDAMVIAPASADVLAKCALGLADDLLSTAVLALDEHKPFYLAPAMNCVMWGKTVVQEHVATLRQRGAQILGPVDGHLACGESGTGAMLDPAAIAAAITDPS